MIKVFVGVWMKVNRVVDCSLKENVAVGNEITEYSKWKILELDLKIIADESN